MHNPKFHSLRLIELSAEIQHEIESALNRSVLENELCFTDKNEMKKKRAQVRTGISEAVSTCSIVARMFNELFIISQYKIRLLKCLTQLFRQTQRRFFIDITKRIAIFRNLILKVKTNEKRRILYAVNHAVIHKASYVGV